MRIGYRISCLVVGTALLATAVLTWIGYSTARSQYFVGVDRQLTASAAALPGVIGDDYLGRALGNHNLSTEEYDRLVHTLNDLADCSDVYYLYAFAQEGDRMVHLATSASAAERAAGDWAVFRQPYEEPPAEFMSTFADGQTRIAEYTDEFGEFRSIFVRRSGPNGRSYLIGVDIALSRIRSELNTLVWSYLLAGGLVAALTGTLGILLARRITRPLQVLSREVDAWSQRDFASDDTIRKHLVALARQHRDETGELAARFLDVQVRLKTYLRDLVEMTAARQKIEQQLEIAKSIQEGLLPKETPQIENFQVIGWSQPADQTGGDYFDWLELPDGRLILTIGDVTGHGIGPALLAAASRAYARATFNADSALDETIARINELLHVDLQADGRFVTLVACLLNPKSRQMKLVAAGHGPTMVYSRRRDELYASMDTHGLPLGVTDEFDYERPMELQFEPGDVLVLVSDGFFEWSNAEGESYGTERLSRSILAGCREAPDQIIERLRADIAAFHGGTSQSDDTTALVIRCVG